ncbi:hypothetical protein L3Q82_023213, partial [Scortum barcoo]
IEMLEIVSALDPVKNNVIQFFEVFEHRGLTCLAFELLDRSLFDHLVHRHFKPLSLTDIRQVAQQMLTALDALKNIGVIHADIKPDNIMLSNNQDGLSGLRVKLIDFGLSITTSQVTPGMVIQPLGYRAPEVILGLPITEAIDMWGLGCVLIFLYISSNPFSIDCQYQMMRDIVIKLGKPSDHLLSAGIHTHTFFNKNQYCENPYWWLKTPMEYHMDSGMAPKKWRGTFRGLNDLIRNKSNLQMWQDEMAFVSLLKYLLHMDPAKRMSPEEALRHPFVTAAHLMDETGTSSNVVDWFDKVPPWLVNIFEEELPIATSGKNSAGSATLCSNHSVINTAHTNDGAATDGDRDATGLADKPAIFKTPSATVGSLSCSFTDEPHKNEGATAAGIRDTAGSAEKKSAACKTSLRSAKQMPAFFKTPSASVGSPSRSFTNQPHTNDGGGAAGKRDAHGSTINESAASRSSSFLAEEIPASDEKPTGYNGSHFPTDQTPSTPKEAPSAEGPPAKVQKSRIKRLKKFFGRAIRTLFGNKKC